jgi:hypothetical protein
VQPAEVNFLEGRVASGLDLNPDIGQIFNHADMGKRFGGGHLEERFAQVRPYNG